MIAVYGATGYTGRLVARELVRRGLDARLCGRNADKLRALADELGGGVETRVAAVDDRTALATAFEGADAVITCAGPFTFYGGPVLEAALAAGAHCLDTTGEQPYMQKVFEHLDGPARAAGCAVVPAAAFDYVPGDLACSLAARGLEPLREVVIAYAVSGLGVTRGTMHSVVEMLTGGDLEYVDGGWRPAGRAPLGERFDFGGSVGSQLVARYPGGEVVTVPRHVRTRAVRERIAASSFAPVAAVAPLVAGASVAAGAVLRTPVRAPVDAIIDRLPEGPSDDARRSARFTVVAEAHGEDGGTGRVVVRGGDVYGLTAVMVVELARHLAEDASAPSGVLAPAQVVDATEFLGFLADHGVTYEVEGAERAGHSARA